MITGIKSPEELDLFLLSHPAVLVYFSTNHCGVCKTLKPKVETLIQQEFPKMEMVYINTAEIPQIAGQHRVFTVPVILVFFLGQETIRKIRSFHVNELIRAISRPYAVLFTD